MLEGAKRVHFIGIGGIGMSSIAAILSERGFSVSGSDIKPNRLTEELARRGAAIFIGHRSSNLSRDADLVVYSTSIDEDNPEMIEAKREEIPIVHRSDVVAALVNPKKGVAVTGAHGKTTTTSLCALLLARAGLDPTVIVGGEAANLNGNYRNGAGDFVVCEADESDGSFTKLKPAYGILTNIDREHLEHYRDFEGLLLANRMFMENIKPGGCLITSYDDENVKRLLKDYKDRCLTYSVSAPGADMRARDIKMEEFHSSFEAIFMQKAFGRFELNAPGRHNVENALAVILLGLELGIGRGPILEALRDYKGTLRRFEVKAQLGGIMVIEDYAHHPREIMATIEACKNWPGRRLVGVFQPHRYTRTKFLREEFGKCFLGLDELVLTDIYSASEKPIEGVTTQIIYDEAVKNGQKNARLMKKEKITAYLLDILKDGDMVLILGAGDIEEVADELAERLRVKWQNTVQRAAMQAYNLQDRRAG
jgi:UDP-N-acetylmuramate--alanine ligase